MTAIPPNFESLRAYLNSLPTPEQADFAIRAGTTIGYLRKAMSVKPRIDGAIVRKLDEKSGGAVSRHELRPDIWPPDDKQTEAK